MEKMMINNSLIHFFEDFIIHVDTTRHTLEWIECIAAETITKHSDCVTTTIATACADVVFFYL
jgi:hypothetical protein